MKRLNSGRIGLVVTTELAARGLDAPILSHAINLDLPTDATVSSKMKDVFEFLAECSALIQLTPLPVLVLSVSALRASRRAGRAGRASRHCGVPRDPADGICRAKVCS